MRLTILGSGSPEPYVRRASSGYLLETGQDRILLDCGGGVFDNLLRSGRQPGEITHLFFTHLHSDHMFDYARLVHAAWDMGSPPLKVWGPSPIAAITERYFGREGVLSWDLRARTERKQSQDVWVARGGSLPRPWPSPEVVEISPGFQFEGNGWRLRSCEVPHVQPYLQCMGFAVETGNRKFVYSGDAGLCDELASMSTDADLLLHWCYRLSIDEVSKDIAASCPTPYEIARMAKAANVRRLILTHFRVEMDREGGHESALAEMRQHLGENASIAEDLDCLEI